MLFINAFSLLSKVIFIVAIVFFSRSSRLSPSRIIISSGVLSHGLDPFTGDGRRHKRAASIRSLRWHLF